SQGFISNVAAVNGYVRSPGAAANTLIDVAAASATQHTASATRNLKKPILHKTLGADRPVDEGSAAQATHVVDSTSGNVETTRRRDVETSRTSLRHSTSIDASVLALPALLASAQRWPQSKTADGKRLF
ncbi:hypothetical protein THAOC_29955, partial [Thalassiosira oceanica]